LTVCILICKYINEKDLKRSSVKSFVGEGANMKEERKNFFIAMAVLMGLCTFLCCKNSCAYNRAKTNGAKNSANNTHAKIEINFDRLFPQTPFTSLFDSCMQLSQLCQEFGIACKTKPCGFDEAEAEDDFDFFTDLLVGKLFTIKMSIGKLACQKPAAHKEDLCYLAELFDDMLCDYKTTCSGFLDKPKSGYVSCLISDIKVKLKSFE